MICSSKDDRVQFRVSSANPQRAQKWSSHGNSGNRATGDKTDQVRTLPDHGHIWFTTRWKEEGHTMYILKTEYQKCPPSPSTSPIFSHSPRIRGHRAIPW